MVLNTITSETSDSAPHTILRLQYPFRSSLTFVFYLDRHRVLHIFLVCSMPLLHFDEACKCKRVLPTSLKNKSFAHYNQ